MYWSTSRTIVIEPGPAPKVDRKGQPYYTTNQPAKDVERVWLRLRVVRATRKLVRMGQYQPKHACA